MKPFGIVESESTSVTYSTSAQVALVIFIRNKMMKKRGIDVSRYKSIGRGKAPR